MQLLFAGIVVAVVGAERASIEARDIVDGYRQNFAEFRTLHVQWRRVLTNAENFFNRLEVAAHDVEEQGAREGVSAEEKARLLALAQRYRDMAMNPKNHAPNVLPQDFWTDGTGFQIRIPAPDLGDKNGSWRFPPSAPKIGTEALERDYMQTLVICFNGRLEDGFRVWSARRKDDVYAGTIQSSPPDSEATNFPPLGSVKREWGSYWHPFDDFFAGPDEQLAVVGEEELAGRRTIVIERVTENPHKELRLTPDDLKKYGDKVRMFDVVRAWVDPERGYIPLKLEWDGYNTYDGTRLSPRRKYPSYRTVDDIEITSVNGSAGYYPVGCVMRFYTLDAHVRGPFVTLGAMIEGKEPPDLPSRLDQECRWEVSLVEANRDMTGLLSLEFPDGTTWYDARQSRSFITGDAKKVLDDALATRSAQPTSVRWGALPVLTLVAIMLGASALVWRLATRSRRLPLRGAPKEVH